MSRVGLSARLRARARLAIAGAAVLAAASLPACAEVETEASHGYEPSAIEEVKGSDMKLVTFTAEGAKRVGLETAVVRNGEKGTVIPYAALVYDPEGKTYVYASPKPLSFLREPVDVDRIDGNRVLVSDGPPAGTEVVTVGAAEVYGTELEIASK